MSDEVKEFVPPKKPNPGAAALAKVNAERKAAAEKKRAEGGADSAETKTGETKADPAEVGGAVVALVLGVVGIVGAGVAYLALRTKTPERLAEVHQFNRAAQ